MEKLSFKSLINKLLMVSISENGMAQMYKNNLVSIIGFKLDCKILKKLYNTFIISHLWLNKGVDYFDDKGAIFKTYNSLKHWL